MAIDLPSYLQTRRRFLANRAAFPVGTRKVRRAVGRLEPRWQSRGSQCRPGEDPAACVIEGIPGDGGLFGELDGIGE
jgi:hypothetical protein